MFLDGMLKTKSLKRAKDMLRRLCIHSKVAKVFALRELLERSLFRSDNKLFGAEVNHFKNGIETTDTSLLKQNKKIVSFKTPLFRGILNVLFVAQDYTVNKTLVRF